MNTHAPVAPEQRPTFRELLERVIPAIFVVPVAGPPVILLLGPWLLIVMLLIPPAAFLITLALVVAVAGALGVALGALLASPYLLVRHVRARQLAHERPVEIADARGARPVHQPIRARLAHLTTR